MPTYDYKCKNCGHEFEDFHQVSDNTTQECPKCGEKSAERQIGGGSGLIFKGSGFYETDYNNNSTSQQSEDSSSDETTSETSTSETSTTKKAKSKS